MLPVNKVTYDYAGYDLTYYLNDVTIDNAEVLVEYDSDGLAKGTYQYGLERLSTEHGNSVSQCFLYNGTGSVVQTSESNGSLALRYTYDPFGTPYVRSPALLSLADTTSYTYNGESYNYTTGLQYLRARYYNTSTGSFISQDTYLGDILNPLSQNRYTYCHNNPVMYDDPSGYEVVITTGGHFHESEDGVYNYQFIETGLQQVMESSKSGENVTMLVADTGWTEQEKKDIEEAVKIFSGGNAKVEFFNDANQVTNYINTKNLGNAGTANKNVSSQRKSDKVTEFYAFSHGTMTNTTNKNNTWAALSYGYDSDYNNQLKFSSDKQIANINGNAFAINSESYFYACRTGVPLDANSDTASFAQLWANATGSYTVGATARTSYSLTRGNVPNGSLLLRAFGLGFVHGFTLGLLYSDEEYSRALNHYGYIYSLMQEAETYKANRACYEKIYKEAYKARTGEDYKGNVLYPAFHKPIIDIDIWEATGQFEEFVPN